MHLTDTLDVKKFNMFRMKPAAIVRPASTSQAELARPWVTMNGQSEFEVLEFSDGNVKHAPELVDHLRKILAAKAQPALLIFAHRGHQIECMMPLLPSLMHAIGYRGPAQAIRIDQNQPRHETDRKIKRFTFGQLPADGFALLVDDRLSRIGPKGHVKAGTVEVSFLKIQSPEMAENSI